MAPMLRNLLLYWLPLVIYAAFILLVSSIPLVELNVRLALSDKLLHFLEYAILATLLARALGTIQLFQNSWRVVLGSLAITIILGGLDEWIQYSVPHRKADFWDWLADLAGGALGVCLTITVNCLWKKKANKNRSFVSRNTSDS